MYSSKSVFCNLSVIGLDIAVRTKYSRAAASIALIGGLIPSIAGLVFSYIFMKVLRNKGEMIDPIIALPGGGIVGTIATGQAKKMMDFASTGIWIYDRFIWCDRSSGCSYDPCWMLCIRLSASWKFLPYQCRNIENVY